MSTRHPLTSAELHEGLICLLYGEDEYAKLTSGRNARHPAFGSDAIEPAKFKKAARRQFVKRLKEDLKAESHVRAPGYLFWHRITEDLVAHEYQTQQREPNIDKLRKKSTVD